LNPIKIFDGSFGGETLWENPHYISPNQVIFLLKIYNIPTNLICPAQYRMKLKRDMGNKYAARLSSRLDYEQRQPEQIHAPRPLESVFQGNPIEQALRINEERINKAANEDTESASDDNNDEGAEPVKKPKTNKAGKLKATVAKKAAARKMKKKLKGKK
jgi:ribosome biogenesis protein BRX1